MEVNVKSSLSVEKALEEPNPVLFCSRDGSPMTFHVEAARDLVMSVRRVLPDFGGKYIEKYSDMTPHTILLVSDDGFKQRKYSRPAICITYIGDCIQSNSLLDINEYIHPWENPEKWKNLDLFDVVYRMKEKFPLFVTPQKRKSQDGCAPPTSVSAGSSGLLPSPVTTCDLTLESSTDKRPCTTINPLSPVKVESHLDETLPPVLTNITAESPPNERPSTPKPSSPVRLESTLDETLPEDPAENLPSKKQCIQNPSSPVRLESPAPAEASSADPAHETISENPPNERTCASNSLSPVRSESPAPDEALSPESALNTTVEASTAQAHPEPMLEDDAATIYDVLKKCKSNHVKSPETTDEESDSQISGRNLWSPLNKVSSSVDIHDDLPKMPSPCEPMKVQSSAPTSRPSHVKSKATSSRQVESTAVKSRPVSKTEELLSRLRTASAIGTTSAPSETTVKSNSRASSCDRHSPFGPYLDDTLPMEPPKRGRGAQDRYRTWEQHAILMYLIENKKFRNLSGVTVWKEMAKKKILPKRTWQSMKNQFLKTISKKLDSFDFLTEEDRQKFRNPPSESDDDDDSSFFYAGDYVRKLQARRQN